jgi:hypothetical protein
MPCGRSRGRHGRGGGCGRGEGEAVPEGPPVNADSAAVLAEMQGISVELNALCQASEMGAAAGGPPPVAPGGVAAGGGEPTVPLHHPFELRDWCGMSLEKFCWYWCSY